MDRFQLRVDQSGRIPVTQQSMPGFTFRYAFDRSADSQKAGAPGQDYLTVIAEGKRLAFVLCDGVSQSFYGDLAARILGGSLVDWLWAGDLPPERANFEQALEVFLDQLNLTAHAEVENFTLPADLAPMLRTVLDRKRSLGSETTFMAGCLDQAQGRVWLAWMGDSRLRIWRDMQERTDLLLGLDNFQTRERWSTHRGRIGTLHTVVLPADEITRLLTYSDGLARLDRRVGSRSPSPATLEQVISESQKLPVSDDISLLEVWPGAAPRWSKNRPKPPARVHMKSKSGDGRLAVSWRSVPRASGYEVALISPSGWRIYPADETGWTCTLDQLPPGAESLAVRCWVEEEAGLWSREVSLNQFTVHRQEQSSSRSTAGLPAEPLRVQTPMEMEVPPAVTRRRSWRTVLLALGLAALVGVTMWLLARGISGRLHTGLENAILPPARLVTMDPKLTVVEDSVNQAKDGTVLPENVETVSPLDDEPNSGEWINRIRLWLRRHWPQDLQERQKRTY